jgi:hypothetical protein
MSERRRKSVDSRCWRSPAAKADMLSLADGLHLTPFAAEQEDPAMEKLSSRLHPLHSKCILHRSDLQMRMLNYREVLVDG